MNEQERQAITDFFECQSMEAVEALHEALDALKVALEDDQ